MTESFRAKSCAIRATSGLSGCWVPGRLENEMTRESLRSPNNWSCVLHRKLASNWLEMALTSRACHLTLKASQIQRLQNTASWFPGAATRLLPLHCPNRFLENCYQICLLFCRALHQREGVDLVLQFLAVGCRHELFRVLHSQVCFRSCTQKKFLLNDAHRWIIRIQMVTNDLRWLRQKCASKAIHFSTEIFTRKVLSGRSVYRYRTCRAHMSSDSPTKTIGTCGEKCRISGFHFVTTFSYDVFDAME